MTVTLHTPKLSGTLSAIASKSQAHRLLICAALSGTPSKVLCAETSSDIDATVRCLNSIGAQINYEDGGFHVIPLPLPISGERILDCGESGSTLRFMLPICCVFGVEAVFRMSGLLPRRPLTPLYEELISHGCALSPQGMNPLRTSGFLASGSFTIPGDISSQFISGLMFSLPLLAGDSQIKITGEMESKPYIDLTISALGAFGIMIKPGDHCFRIAGHQRYNPVQPIVSVEGDWSNAAFWLCAGAIGRQSVTVTNLRRDSLQGDKRVLSALECFGAHITYGTDSVTVSGGQLKGIEFDAGDTPDLVPILAAVASVSEGRTVIHNARRLRIKESDRLKTVSEMLRLLGADITETPDGLIISGKAHLTGGAVSSHGDHRIAMAAAIVSAVCSEAVTIYDAEAVNKSYPGFFKDFTALGGQMSF
jgi:3-phosphoshikimate 1-carboxyvinyltransferase